MSHATSLKAVQSQTNSTLPGPTAESQASSVTPPGARISAQFPEEQLRGVYRAIYARRDIRHFLPDPIPDQILARLVQAAHHGPSVGFMQPWDLSSFVTRACASKCGSCSCGNARLRPAFLMSRAAPSTCP